MTQADRPSIGEVVHFDEGGECRAAIITKRSSLMDTGFDLAVIDPNVTPLGEGRIEMRWEVGDSDWHRKEHCPNGM